MRKKHGKNRDAMLLTLCASCARQFYDSPEHTIRRADAGQRFKETCTYCGMKQGYDYTVAHKKGGKPK